MQNIPKDIKPFPTYKERRVDDLEWPKLKGPEYWEYRRKWVEYPKKMFAGEFPIHLDIETTNVCNLLCEMCSRTIQIEKGTFPKIETMDMILYKKLIDEGSENGLCSIKLNYLGEPLLDLHLSERIRYAKEKGIIDVMMNTNATVLTEEISKKILEAGIDTIAFSVDSINRERFNKIRTGADYDTVVKNIKNFMKIKRDGNYGHVQTRVQMTVMKSNMHEVDEFASFWLPIVGIVGFCEMYDHTSIHGEESDYNPDFICAQPFQRLFCMVDGTATPCCADDGKGYPLGNLRTKTIKEIWQGGALKKLREYHINGKYRDIDICRRCYIPLNAKGS